MKTHSTNYFNTFIEIAADSPVQKGIEPPIKGEKKSIANHQFDLFFEHPYEYSSDDIFFHVFAIRKEIPENERSEARELIFSKGQPCFRSSPLTKRYGWGIHSNEKGNVAMYSASSEMYEKFQNDDFIKKVKAMAMKRKQAT